MKLQARYSLTIIAMVIVIAASLSVSLIMQFRETSAEINTLHNELLRDQLVASATRQATNVADQLAKNLSNPVYFLDMESIQRLVEVVAANPEIQSVTVVDNKFSTLTSDGGYPIAPGGKASLSKQVEERVAGNETVVVQGADSIQVIYPIVIGYQFIGAVCLKYSLRSIAKNTTDLSAVLNIESEKAYAKFTESSVFITILLVVVGAVVSLYIVQLLQNPILKLVHFANQMGRGDFQYKVQIDRNDELGQLASSLNEMATRLDQRTREIQFLAFHDGLTKLPNRDYFKTCLANAIKRAKRYHTGFSLLFIDIDNFKVINDVYGHAAGDHVLVHLAARIQSCLREIDLVVSQPDESEQSVQLGRLAGDEFIALLEGTDNKIDVAAVSQRILDTVSKPFQWKSNSISLGISIGIALYPDNGDEVDTLLRNADAAMYFVKKQGKNNFQFFSRQLDRQTHDQLLLLEDLGRALEGNELELWYQPQFNLHTRELVGTEALLRWRHPTRGLLMPDSFLPLVEKSVHVYELGGWVIRHAIAQLGKWHAIDSKLCMAINISPLQLQRQGWLIKQLNEALPNQAMAAKVDLEITESFFINAEENAIELLTELNNAGFHIWLDDFGTGFSSLNHLKHFPVDGVKIDKTYVTDMTKQVKNLSLTKAIIQVADAFGIRVIAEGVETLEQEYLLKQLKCSLVQGFLYCEPIPPADFEILLRSYQSTDQESASTGTRT